MLLDVGGRVELARAAAASHSLTLVLVDQLRKTASEHRRITWLQFPLTLYMRDLALGEALLGTVK